VESILPDLMERYPGDMLMIVALRKFGARDVAGGRRSPVCPVDMSGL
jgi:hypothetical protein